MELKNKIRTAVVTGLFALVLVAASLIMQKCDSISEEGIGSLIGGSGDENSAIGTAEGNTGNISSNGNASGNPASDIKAATLEEELASDTYGLLWPHDKCDYIPRTEYSGISTDEEFLRTMMAGVGSCTRGIVINYDSRDYKYWEQKYLVNINLSEMNNAANEFFIEVNGEKSLVIFPMYKASWFALTYYKYVRPGMDEELKEYITPDEDTLKMLEMAHKLAEDAIKAHPGDERAILEYVTDRICDMTEYSDPVPPDKHDPSRDITGVFINHSAVCEGYTAAMQLVLSILGYDNHVVKNRIDNHIWNRVKVGGTWYHIDATWNESQDSAGNYYHKWFMLTDDEITAQNNGDTHHDWDRNMLY